MARSPALHILVVSNTGPFLGGADRDWVNLARELAPLGIRFSWAGIQGASHMAELIPLCRIVDTQLVPFRDLLNWNQYTPRGKALWARIVLDHLLRQNLAPLRRLDAGMDGDRPDVVISNTSVVTIGALWAFARRIPHVWCVKEYLDPDVTACRAFARVLLALSRVVTVPSSACAAAFPAAVRVIPDGTPVAEVRRSAARRTRHAVLVDLGLPDNRPVVAQVGVITDWKGHICTAQAFVSMARHHSEPPCSLVFLGKAAPHKRTELESVFAPLPEAWRHAVRFGQYDPDDFTLLGAADVLIHPSVLPDPFPNAVREAMALGKPVVASRLGGIPELVADGVTGILVDGPDPNALANALERLFQSEALRRRMGEEGQQRADSLFSMERVAPLWLDMLQAVFGRTI